MEKPARSPRGALIRLREAAGLTQKQLAMALGLKSDRAVRAWEHGLYAPSIDFVLPLARLFGVPVQDVVEAIAGPDPGAGRSPAGNSRPRPGLRRHAGGRTLAPPNPEATRRPLPAETLTALTHHITELARLLDDLEAAQGTAGPRDRDASAT